MAYGRDKLARKGLDAVVVNDVARPGIGFDATDNEVTIVTADGERPVPRADKATIARAILQVADGSSTRPRRPRGGGGLMASVDEGSDAAPAATRSTPRPRSPGALAAAVRRVAEVREELLDDLLVCISPRATC